MSSNKNQQQKHQEPPAGKQSPGEVPETPMATAAPSIEDRLEALELANIELEKRLRKHEEHHFGRAGT